MSLCQLVHIEQELGPCFERPFLPVVYRVLLTFLELHDIPVAVVLVGYQLIIFLNPTCYLFKERALDFFCSLEH